MKAAVAALKVALAALGLGGLSLLSGCAHDFLYVPVGPGAAGGPAMRYPIPPTVPQGEAYVTSFGFTDIDLGPGAPKHVAACAARGLERQPDALECRRTHAGAHLRRAPTGRSVVPEHRRRRRSGVPGSAGTGARVRPLLRAAGAVRSADEPGRVLARLAGGRGGADHPRSNAIPAFRGRRRLVRALPAVRRGRSRFRVRLVVRPVLSVPSPVPAGLPSLLLSARAWARGRVAWAASDERGPARLAAGRWRVARLAARGRRAPRHAADQPQRASAPAPAPAPHFSSPGGGRSFRGGGGHGHR